MGDIGLLREKFYRSSISQNQTLASSSVVGHCCKYHDFSTSSRVCCRSFCHKPPRLGGFEFYSGSHVGSHNIAKNSTHFVSAPRKKFYQKASHIPLRTCQNHLKLLGTWYDTPQTTPPTMKCSVVQATGIVCDNGHHNDVILVRRLTG